MGKISLVKEAKKACKSPNGIPKKLMHRLEASGYAIRISEKGKVSLKNIR